MGAPGSVVLHARRDAVDRAWWSAYARMYDRLWNGPLSDRLADAVVALAGPPVGITVDVGAGTGLIAARLAAAGHQLVCVDAEMAMLRRLRARIPHALALVGRLDRLPLPARCAQIVVATNVLHLCADRAAAVRALAELVAPGGALICSWPSQNATFTTIARREHAGAVPLATVAGRFLTRWALSVSARMLTRIRPVTTASLESTVRRVAGQRRLTVVRVDLSYAAQTLFVLRPAPPSTDRPEGNPS